VVNMIEYKCMLEFDHERLWYSISACFLHRYFSITLNLWGREERDVVALILTLENWCSPNDLKKFICIKRRFQN
jgi:hypothetical protein